MELSKGESTQVCHTVDNSARGDLRHQTDTNICIICLSIISERAVASPCNHLDFDLHCLVQWLQASASCPLCKATVNEVQYDFQDVDNYKRYIVPKALQQTQHTPTSHDRTASETRAVPSALCVTQHSPALDVRRQIYEHGVFSLHIGSNALSGYKAFTVQEFAASTGLQAKARMFLRRELQVFDDKIVDQPATRVGRQRIGTSITIGYMIEYIVAILRRHEIKSFDGHAQELISEYLGQVKARILLHELDAWLRSPYASLEDWDQAVQYIAAA